jgi:hypothetical protein
MNFANALFVFGLTLDILGAFYLAQSFITKNLEDLTFEGTSGYGSPPNLRYIRSNLYQKAEAQIGFILLTFGFALQSLDYFFLSSERSPLISTISVLCFVIALIIVVLLMAMFVRAKLFQFYAKRMAHFVIQWSISVGDSDDEWIMAIADYLLPTIKRTSNETEHSFVERVIAEVKSK